MPAGPGVSAEAPLPGPEQTENSMNGSLFLFPEDPFLVPPAHGQIPALLQSLGITGAILDENSYLVGENFLRHITFAGCSPHLVLAPPEDGCGNFSHLTLHGPFDRLRLFTTTNRSKPRCPQCRLGITGWQEVLPLWLQDPAASWQCRGCGHTGAVASLDWRQYAAVGRLLLEIHNVFPGEAFPGDVLMREIQTATECSWRHGWADGTAG